MTRTLLIINDDIDSGNFYKTYLTCKNVSYVIKTAYDSNDALKLAHAFQPSVALVDRNLREGSGTGLKLAMHLTRKFNTKCILISSDYSPIGNQHKSDMVVTHAKAAFNTPIQDLAALINTIDTLMSPELKKEAK